MPLCGEGLNHVEAIDFLAKIGRGELRPSVCVEHDALGDAPELHCIPQRINGEETVDFSAYPTGDDFPGVQIQNSADIAEAIANPNILWT